MFSSRYMPHAAFNRKPALISPFHTVSLSPVLFHRLLPPPRLACMINARAHGDNEGDKEDTERIELDAQYGRE